MTHGAWQFLCICYTNNIFTEIKNIKYSLKLNRQLFPFFHNFFSILHSILVYFDGFQVKTIQRTQTESKQEQKSEKIKIPKSRSL